MSTCHWLLIVDELSIPEISSEIPKPFISLISNLKRNRDHAKTAVILGNVGSNAPPVEFFKSLVDNDHFHIIRGALPSEAKLTTSFSISGIKFGVVHSHQVKLMQTADQKDIRILFSPRLSSFFPKENIEVIILGGLAKPLTTISTEGHLVLAPGPITGKCPFPAIYHHIDNEAQRNRKEDTGLLIDTPVEAKNQKFDLSEQSSKDHLERSPLREKKQNNHHSQTLTLETKPDCKMLATDLLESQIPSSISVENSPSVSSIAHGEEEYLRSNLANDDDLTFAESRQATFMLANVEETQLKVFIYSLGMNDESVSVKEVQIPRMGAQG